MSEGSAAQRRVRLLLQQNPLRNVQLLHRLRLHSQREIRLNSRRHHRPLLLMRPFLR